MMVNEGFKSSIQFVIHLSGYSKHNIEEDVFSTLLNFMNALHHLLNETILIYFDSLDLEHNSKSNNNESFH